MPRSASGARWRPRTAGLSEATAAADGKSRRRGLCATDAAARHRALLQPCCDPVGCLVREEEVAGLQPSTIVNRKIVGGCSQERGRRILRAVSGDVMCVWRPNLGKQATTLNGISGNKQQRVMESWEPSSNTGFPKKSEVFRVSVENQCCCLILRIVFSVLACFARLGIGALHSAISTSDALGIALGIALDMITCDALSPLLESAAGRSTGHARWRPGKHGGGAETRRTRQPYKYGFNSTTMHLPPGSFLPHTDHCCHCDLPAHREWRARVPRPSLGH
jgi:hypothetical protein